MSKSASASVVRRCWVDYWFVEEEEMTVRRHAGDAGGDHVIPTPATVEPPPGAPDRDSLATALPVDGSPASEVLGGVSDNSPERSIGGRFWALQSEDEDDGGSGDEEAEESADEASSGRGRYRLAYCQTPSPSRDADLAEGSSELNRRQLKRLRRRDGQRLAAQAALFFSSGEGYPYGVTLGPVVGSTVTGGTAGCYGYWMHTAPDGRSGYLVPGWLAAQ